MHKRRVDNLYIPTNVYLSDDEVKMIGWLVYLGRDIRFLPPSRIKGQRTPDVSIDGVLWEIKSPHGSGEQTLGRAFKVALKQSPNVVFNLRSCPIPTLKAVRKLTKEFHMAKSAKRLIIITKAGKFLDIPK
jgi:transposase